jgi:hypothetical protein
MMGFLVRQGFKKFAYSVFLVAFIAQTSAAEEAANVLSYRGVELTAPTGWTIQYSVISDASGAKIGEFFGGTKPVKPGKRDGKKFVSYYRKGFASEGTKLVSSGVSVVGDKTIYWVCRRTEWEGSHGNTGMWYPRIFLVPVAGGTVELAFYSTVSCTDSFQTVLSVAASATVSREVGNSSKSR